MNAPIIWFSKKQNTVDEFVAMRIAQDLIVSLRYKLRMFTIQVEDVWVTFGWTNGRHA